MKQSVRTIHAVFSYDSLQCFHCQIRQFMRCLATINGKCRYCKVIDERLKLTQFLPDCERKIKSKYIVDNLLDINYLELLSLISIHCLRGEV